MSSLHLSLIIILNLCILLLLLPFVTSFIHFRLPPILICPALLSSNIVQCEGQTWPLYGLRPWFCLVQEVGAKLLFYLRRQNTVTLTLSTHAEASKVCLLYVWWGKRGAHQMCTTNGVKIDNIVNVFGLNDNLSFSFFPLVKKAWSCHVVSYFTFSRNPSPSLLPLCFSLLPSQKVPRNSCVEEFTSCVSFVALFPLTLSQSRGLRLSPHCFRLHPHISVSPFTILSSCAFPLLSFPFHSHAPMGAGGRGFALIAAWLQAFPGQSSWAASVCWMCW